MKWITATILIASMLDVRQIKSLRGQKNTVDPFVPYHFLHEHEIDAEGTIQKINTIFLTSRECPFQCLMCDLWKNTLDDPTPAGAILQQIDYALKRLPEASVIKLYNSGNFFDTKAVPPEDYKEIARRLQDFERVIVENHPNLCNDLCLLFNDLLEGKLEIAMGLETIHPEVLPLLHKQLTPEDFQRAAEFLTANEIDVRTFVLLNPPFLYGDKDNIDWTLRAVKFAFDCGSHCCSVIPTRSGNGIMNKLQHEGRYFPPSLEALEEVFDSALSLNRGRVFVDLWDLEAFSNCPNCFDVRKNRLEKMNLDQRIYPEIKCTCNA